ncbi:imidazolonepropionase, partial [Paenibacillus ehimensis]|nr:imidazolonepropionase [Paenibacillus ehimensis]
MEQQRIDLLVHNIGELITMAGEAGPRTGSRMADVPVVKGGAVAMRDDVVVAAGSEADVRAQLAGLPVA